MCVLRENYGVGNITIYDIKKQRDKILKFYAKSECCKNAANRKLLHGAKNVLDQVIYECKHL